MGCVLRGLGQGKERTEIRGWVTLSFTPRRHTRQPGVTHRGADISEIEKQQVLVQLIKARSEGGRRTDRRQDIRGRVTFSLRICCHTCLSRVTPSSPSTLERVRPQDLRNVKLLVQF